MSDNSSNNKSTPSPDDLFNDMPDRYIPDNLDEIMQRVYEHGVIQKNTKCSSQGEHDKQKGESEVRASASPLIPPL